MLPLERGPLVGLQAWLCSSADGEVAKVALASLEATDPEILAGVVAEAEEETIEVLADKIPHPEVLTAVLQHRGLSSDALCGLARWIPPELQEVLLLRQDDIRAHHEILDELEKNPNLSAYSERLVHEYRIYLLPQRGQNRAASDGELDELSDEMVEEAIAVVARHVPKVGDFDESTGLTEAQVRALPLPIRIKLGFGASRTLRNILLRDPSSQVALTVLNRSSISEREVEQLCRSRNVSEEVLSDVARHRSWIGKYRIVLTLLKNPRTPVNVSMKHLARLAARDLKLLGADRNVPDPVRHRARVLHQHKVR